MVVEEASRCKTMVTWVARALETSKEILLALQASKVLCAPACLEAPISVTIMSWAAAMATDSSRHAQPASVTVEEAVAVVIAA